MRTLAQNKYIHILQGGSGGRGGGLIALRSQRNAKYGGFTFFYSKYYIPDAKIYPVMMWIQIHARGAEFFYQIGSIQRILSVPKFDIINLKINNFKSNFPQ